MDDETDNIIIVNSDILSAGENDNTTIVNLNIFSDNESNGTTDIDSNTFSDNDNNNINNKTSLFADEKQRPPEYYLAESANLDISRLRQRRYSPKT
jgi:hypothetical protein